MWHAHLDLEIPATALVAASDYADYAIKVAAKREYDDSMSV
jgi:hypothetical protein